MEASGTFNDGLCVARDWMDHARIQTMLSQLYNSF